MGKATKIAAIVGLATMAVATIMVEAAEQAAASTFVTLKLEGPCDAQNAAPVADQLAYLQDYRDHRPLACGRRQRPAGAVLPRTQFDPRNRLRIGSGNPGREVRRLLTAHRERLAVLNQSQDTLTMPGGAELVMRTFRTSESPKAAVIIPSAMGVAQHFYTNFAQ